MKPTELLIHTQDETEPRRLAFTDGATVEEIIVAVFPDGHTDLVLFLEEEIEPKARHHRLHEVGIHHGHHVHIRHKHHPRPPHHEPKLVTVTIDGNKYETQRGINEVEHLRKLGKVPPADVLAEFKDGKFVDLPNDGHVEICGGELFASHVKTAGSS